MFAATGHFWAVGIQPVFTMSQMDNSVRQRAAAKGEHKCKCFGEFFVDEYHTQMKTVPYPPFLLIGF